MHDTTTTVLFFVILLMAAGMNYLFASKIFHNHKIRLLTKPTPPPNPDEKLDYASEDIMAVVMVVTVIALTLILIQYLWPMVIILAISILIALVKPMFYWH